MIIIIFLGWSRSLEYWLFSTRNSGELHHLHLQDPGGEDGRGRAAVRKGGGVHVPRVRARGQAERGVRVGPRVPAARGAHHDAEVRRGFRRSGRSHNKQSNTSTFHCPLKIIN